MPVGYLITVLLVAWGTFFALFPLRGPVLGQVSFRSGLALNELPYLALTWLLCWTLLAFAQHDIASPGGWAAVALAAATAAGLGVVAHRGTRAAPALDRALTEALRPARETARPRPRRRPLAAILLAPLSVRHRGVERLPGIAYGPAGRRNRLDLYRHRSRPQGGPTLVYFHGGGFKGGRRNREARPLLHRLAARGWVCVSADYRLLQDAAYPAALTDAKKVIAWVREHGPEYGADPATVFVAGSSAGAHQAAMVALTADDPGLQPGFEGTGTAVAGAICLYGWYGDVWGAGEHTSPASHVRADAPPFFIVHGDRDTCAHVEDARHFAGRLRDASSSPVVYAELPGAQHSFDLFRSRRFEAVVDAVEEFTTWVGATKPTAFTK